MQSHHFIYLLCILVAISPVLVGFVSHLTYLILFQGQKIKPNDAHFSTVKLLQNSFARQVNYLMLFFANLGHP